MTAETMTKEEFCTRFVERMMKSAAIFDGTDDELRSYAKDAADAAWGDEYQREDGPEASADADVSYWGDE